jgi:hypothetical protein
VTVLSLECGADFVTGCQHCHEFPAEQERVWGDCPKNEGIHYVPKVLPLRLSVPPDPSVSIAQTENRITETEYPDELVVLIVEHKESEPATVSG